MKIKEIKEQAKIGLKGNFFKAIIITIFYTIINILVQMLIKNLSDAFSGLNLNGLFTIISIIINLAILPFSYGVIVSLVEIFKGKKISYTDFINISLLNYTKIIKLFIGIFFRVLPYVAIFSVCLFLFLFDFKNPAINLFNLIIFIISFIVLFIKSLNYALALFVYYDNPKLSCKEILNKSKSIINKNKFKYLLLLLSFILWFAFFALINKAMTILGLNINIINYSIFRLTSQSGFCKI